MQKGSKAKKPYNIKPKHRHYELANNLLVNRGNASKAMIQAGYSPQTAKNPKQILESKGFQQIANSIGLTDEFIAAALYEDIRNKPSNRVGELALASKIKGLMVDRSEQVSISQINISFKK